MSRRSSARWFVVSALIAAHALAATGCGADDGSDAGTDARADSGGFDSGARPDTSTHGEDADADADIDAGGDASSGSDASAVDAARDLGCIGEPLPTVAADPVVVSGAVRASDGAGIGGATVEVITRAGENHGAATTATTGQVGSFSVSAPTGGVPLDGYVSVVAAGRAPTRVYPSSPLATSVADLDIRSLTTGTTLAAELNLLYAASGVARQSGTGTIIVLVRDCGHRPLVGATVSFAPAVGAVRYTTGAVVPSSVATQTAADGLAYGLNAPPGDVVVTARYGDQALREVTIGAFANGVTQVLVAP